MKKDFGSWIYDYKRKTLTLKDELAYDYEIDLETIFDSARILDWYHQILNKGWCTPQIIFDLLKAVDFLLGPQSNYCPMGISKNVPASDLLKDFNP